MNPATRDALLRVLGILRVRAEDKDDISLVMALEQLISAIQTDETIV